MKYSLLLGIMLCIQGALWAQTVKVATAYRTEHSPKIDGRADDPEWQQAPVINEFRQYRPLFDKPGGQQTEVRILYDNYALYVLAVMHDTHPDSILRQLGSRDDEDLNTDWFGIKLDTYDNQTDGYSFVVTAAGVQRDFRVADESYNAVWSSAARISDEGWCAELKIPYSAIRFPKIETQQWGLQLLRYVRRNRELDQWALEDNGATNTLVYWGKLQGITHIKPPLRLSLTPYLSTSVEHYPMDMPGASNLSYGFGGGMDLKVGVNESHTLDVTLLPDFSQVQSDNQVKNLTAFETSYNENRSFFQEAVDLFQKGSLFYSRRIGRIPLLYYYVPDELKPGEKIHKNPYQAKLLNAVKFSGRNKKGFALGIFNALTNDTYATIEDSLGNSREILTDPMTNYSIIVMDQVLRNNSSLYLINTNVNRKGDFSNANVTGGGLTLNNKKSSYRLSLSGAVSQIFVPKSNKQNEKDLTDIGTKYSVGFGKISGRFQYWASRSQMDDKFNSNDMGYLAYNNEIEHFGRLYYGFFQPVGIFRELFPRLEASHKTNYVTGKITDFSLSTNTWGTLMNYLSIWLWASHDLAKGYDYYEPRVPEYFYIKPRYSDVELGISSDYRKPLAIDMSLGYIGSDEKRFSMWMFHFSPIIRVSDQLGMNYQFRYYHSLNDIGFATYDYLNYEYHIYFGERNVDEVENTLNVKYLFRNNLSLNLRMRHYWSWGEYSRYSLLQTNGLLRDIENPGIQADFNFNAFNLDLVFSWEFSPGSKMELVWKNSMLNDESVVVHDLFENLRNTWELPQLNTLTFKMLYYLDYTYLKKNKRN